MELTNPDSLNIGLRELSKDNSTALVRLKKQFARANPKTVRLTSPWRWAAVAAVLIVTVGLSLLPYMINRKEIPQQTSTAKTTLDVPPGGNKAMLTLSDGSKIVLDSSPDGTLARQGNAVISKKGEQVIYNVSQGTKSNQDLSLQPNTISTPRGGQWPVVLPDGSKVMLNAESSITFPPVFNANERKVEITGEAYFEVTTLRLHSGQKVPFKVVVNGMEVEVLGTQFNINAYADEPVIATTLLEGSVKVTKEGKQALLKPGQQSQVSRSNQLKVVDKANTEEAVAWKNGVFYLSSADIGSIMRQISRWYDIEVAYSNGIPAGHISGEVPRNLKLSELLKVLRESGVKITTDGKKVMVQ
jgi:ferric-dicitrate binding protein FerR (iron transport regulator)